MRSLIALALLSTIGLGCSDTLSGPAPVGAPFFRATLDGEPWAPIAAGARCYGNNLTIEAYRAFGNPDTTEGVFIILWNLSHLSTISLGDSLSDQYGIFLVQAPTGGEYSTWYHTRKTIPGRATITGLNVDDSLVAGTFRFTVVADADSSLIRTFAGSFRVVLAPPAFVDEPPCVVPSNNRMKLSKPDYLRTDAEVPARRALQLMRGR